MPMTPPPDVGAEMVPDVKRTLAERVGSSMGGALTAFGGGDPSESPLDKSVKAHHQKRLDEARMHRKNTATYASALASGVDPESGQPLSDEQRQQYQNWYNASWEAYSKAAGVNKETKAQIEQHKALVDKIIEKGQQAGSQEAGPASVGQGAATVAKGLTPPPTPPAGGTPSSAKQPTPEKMTPPPGMSAADEAVTNAPRVAQGVADQREFSQWKRQQDILHKHKMEEQAALQKAKAQSGARPRPVHSGSIGVLDAQKLSAQGQVFMGEDGNPIDISKLDPTMGLYGMVVRNDEGKWETVYTPFSPNQRTVTVGNETYAVSPMDISKLPGGGAGADLGQHNTPRSSTHEVPMIGPDGQPVAVQMHTTSTPATTGVKGRGITPPPGAQAAPSSNGKAPAKGAGATGKTTTTPGGKGGAGRPLSALPPGQYNQMLQRVTPVRLAATQLFGDPQNPNFKPLADYASLMDDKDAQQRIASAWNLIRAHADAAGANEHSGDLITLMRNYAGTPGMVAASEADKMKETLDALKPREAEALNRLFSTYGTIIGLRSITKGSAAKFSARNLEQEVPIPGMNVRTKQAFYDKLSTLSEEVNSGWKGIPDVMLTKGEREYDLKQQEELSKKSKGGAGSKKGITPPPGSRTPEQEAEDYLNKHRRK